MIKEDDKSRRGRAARNKGAAAERELSHILEAYGYPVHRGKVFYGESDLVGLPGIHPEVKRQERLNLYQAMEQAEREAAKRGDGMPTVFHRRDRGEWMVSMKLSDWIKIYGGRVDG